MAELPQRATDVSWDDPLNAAQQLAAMRKAREVTCSVCESKFQAVDGKAKYCSNKCKQAAKYARKPKQAVEISCRRCGAAVVTDDRRVRYCSNECKSMHKLFN